MPILLSERALSQNEYVAEFKRWHWLWSSIAHNALEKSKEVEFQLNKENYREKQWNLINTYIINE